MANRLFSEPTVRPLVLPARRLPTLRIVNPKEPAKYLTINLSDFDPEKHQVWKEQTEETIQIVKEALLAEGETEPEVEEAPPLALEPSPAPATRRGRKKAT